LALFALLVSSAPPETANRICDVLVMVSPLDAGHAVPAVPTPFSCDGSDPVRIQSTSPGVSGINLPK
jgi:hypothetical protein